DNPNGVITDHQMKREWLPKDSYGDLGRWVNFQEALSYLNTMVGVYAGGHQDWRLPTQEEALGLFNEDFKQLDWEEQLIHIHPVFVPKCGRFIWTSEENDQGQVLAVNLQDGTTEFYDKTHKDKMAVRLIRVVPAH
ncbi:MAG: DUF1566 domain-containing protein, partial [Nitrospinaceae bacterium]|nr:DUF1566 domain-containing protein [Nitrospinaceae bacterium]NIR54337.1 DUF1566 domain-containing protein [Nitrospinaceae bacterium]NIS84755.1 DUF1566 domain-containing protein [Nitrospinaceae bacterium]NIT81556.1 DUF1566 domain-containing protein [Nitrospinaceae bacterium]NIU43841.1 DUF1566 domain-containing protein [Nitrospinaceae bacterium]